MNSNSYKLLNLIRKLKTEQDALLQSKLTLLDINLSYEQTKLISTIFSDHQKNLSEILDIVKKIYKEEIEE